MQYSGIYLTIDLKIFLNKEIKSNFKSITVENLNKNSELLWKYYKAHYIYLNDCFTQVYPLLPPFNLINYLHCCLFKKIENSESKPETIDANLESKFLAYLCVVKKFKIK